MGPSSTRRTGPPNTMAEWCRSAPSRRRSDPRQDRLLWRGDRDALVERQPHVVVLRPEAQRLVERSPFATGSEPDAAHAGGPGFGDQTFDQRPRQAYVPCLGSSIHVEDVGLDTARIGGYGGCSNHIRAAVAAGRPSRSARKARKSRPMCSSSHRSLSLSRVAGRRRRTRPQRARVECRVYVRPHREPELEQRCPILDGHRADTHAAGIDLQCHAQMMPEDEPGRPAVRVAIGTPTEPAWGLASGRGAAERNDTLWQHRAYCAVSSRLGIGLGQYPATCSR